MFINLKVTTNMSDGDINEGVLPVTDHFKGVLDLFLQDVKQVVSRKNVPAWFNPILHGGW